MEDLKELVDQDEVAKLIEYCEELEFKLAATPDDSVNLDEFYGAFLAAYLIQNELPSARFLWKRIPEEIKTSSEQLRAVWEVATDLWQRDYTPVYYSVEQKPWTPLIGSLMKKVAETLRERIFALLSEAYSSITVEEVSNFIGVPVDRVAQVTAERGWIYDAATNTLQPKKIVEPGIDRSASLGSFSRLTDLVIHLERS
ncbi:10286_t:CDS:2 [Paraglomus brasilianum]|uniref:COP9 signalosome complex subunit 8 n=1 Tax=Paraglomus brasilianum TaxID=144538 RepID=A0A9N9C0Y7_9GLOM|nr:10286_t:CDS:2 [Paraglomus brasilianum]